MIKVSNDQANERRKKWNTGIIFRIWNVSQQNMDRKSKNLFYSLKIDGNWSLWRRLIWQYLKLWLYAIKRIIYNRVMCLCVGILNNLRIRRFFFFFFLLTATHWIDNLIDIFICANKPFLFTISINSCCFRFTGIQ